MHPNLLNPAIKLSHLVVFGLLAYCAVMLHRIDSGLADTLPYVLEQIEGSNKRIDLVAQGMDLANGKLDRLDPVLNSLIEVHYTNPLCR